MTIIRREKIFQMQKSKMMNNSLFVNYSTFTLIYSDFELLTMQAYTNRDSLEKVEDIESKELFSRQIKIMNNAVFDRKMRDFKLRRKIWRKFVLSLLMKIRHLNRYADLINCLHQMFDLKMFIINRSVNFVIIYLLLYLICEFIVISILFYLRCNSKINQWKKRINLYINLLRRTLMFTLSYRLFMSISHARKRHYFVTWLLIIRKWSSSQTNLLNCSIRRIDETNMTSKSIIDQTMMILQTRNKRLFWLKKNLTWKFLSITFASLFLMIDFICFFSMNLLICNLNTVKYIW
jgi:hypothetical protein